jgi:hypothetical protein
MRARFWLIPAAMALGVFCGAGCGASSHVNYDIFPAPSLNPPHLANPKITGEEKVFTRPGYHQLRVVRAALPVFRASPELKDQAVALTRIFYRELLAKRTFREVILIDEPYATPREALSRARELRAEVVVAGEVPYYLDGGTVGQSGLQVDLRILEAATGQLLWEVSDRISATPRPVIDLMIFETRPKPTPGIAALAAELLGRLAATLEQGEPPPPPKGPRGWFSRK